MGDVGGTGKYNATPPSTYCPSAARFRFISENYLCEKCENRFENETEVMIHIRNVHDKDVRKMFASDIMGSWRRSDNLRFFGLFRFSETSGVASSFSQFSPFSITMKPALFLIVFPVGFFDNLLTKESGFCFPELFSSVSTSWAGFLCTCFLCIFNPFLEAFFLPHILHLCSRPFSSSTFFFWANWTLFSSFPPSDGNDDGDDDNDEVLEGGLCQCW